MNREADPRAPQNYAKPLGSPEGGEESSPGTARPAVRRCYSVRAGGTTPYRARDDATSRVVAGRAEDEGGDSDREDPRPASCQLAGSR